MSLTGDDRKELQTRLASINTYVAATLCLLIVLSVVMDQTIRENANALRDLSAVRRRAAIRVAASPAKLNALRERFYELLSAAEATLPPAPEDRTKYTRRLIARNGTSSVPEYLWKNGPFAVSRTQRNALNEALSRAAARDETTYTATMQAAKGILHAQIDRGVSDDRGALATLVAYEKEVNTAGDNAVLAGKAASKHRELLSEKQKVPSPFGNFEIRPRLGLLLLAAACVLSYLVFLLRVARALPRHIDDDDAAGFAPPAWFYSSKRSVQDFFGWHGGDALYHGTSALVVHGAWMLLAAGLAVECFRWNAFATLLVSEPRAVDAARGALIAANALVLLIGLFWILTRRGEYGDGPLSFSRRSALALMGLGVIGLAVVETLRYRRRGTALPKFNRADLRLQTTRLIVNPSSGVAHHPKVCESHLPKRRKEVADTWLHRGREGAILLAVANAVNAEIRDAREEAIFGRALELGGDVPKRIPEAANDLSKSGELTRLTHAYVNHSLMAIEKGIELEPFSVHLYDAAIRRYGRLKEFQRIGPVLDGGIARTRVALHNASKKREKEKLQRVLAALESRQAHHIEQQDPKTKGAVMLPGTAADSESCCERVRLSNGPPVQSG